MFNRILLGVIAVLTVLLIGYAIKSKVDSVHINNEKQKVEELKAVNTTASLNMEASVIAAKAQGEIDQIDKEKIDENITYDVGTFHYRFD